LSLTTVAIITLACVLMAVTLTPGLPTTPELAARMTFIEQHTTLWQWGWISWMAGSLSLFLFGLLLLDYIPTQPLKYFAIGQIAIGVVPDIAAEILYAFALPKFTSQPAQYVLLEQIAQLFTGVFANSAYCLGGLLLNLLLLCNRRLPRALVLLGLPSWLIGFGLSVAIIIDNLPLAVSCTAISMVWNVIWIFLMGVLVFPHPNKYAVTAHAR
jgi:hypothetical protein